MDDATPDQSPITHPPPFPWGRGEQRVEVDGIRYAYTTVHVVVEVCRDEIGQVFSHHRLSDEGDEKTIGDWPGGGQQEVAFALLTEAVRREALVEFLVQMSNDKTFLEEIKALEGAELEAKLAELTKALRVQMNRTVGRLADAAIRETFALVTQ